MIYEIYAIKDELTSFTDIKLELNENVAKRNFTYAVKNGPIMKSNPENFSLWKLGDYDTETGYINGLNNSAIKVLSANSIILGEELSA